MPDAIIIAGGSIHDPELARSVSVPTKAEIVVAGKPVVWWIWNALKQSERFDRIAVVSAGHCLELVPEADVCIEERADEAANIFAGIEALEGSDLILMSAGDTPLVTPESVRDLLDNAPDADVVFPVVMRADIEREYAERGKDWIFVKAKDGEFTGCNSFLFKPDVLARKRDVLEQVLAARRSVWELVKMWGAGFVWKYMTGQLDLAAVEAYLSQSLGIRGRAYVTHYPELAMDIDHPGDVSLAEERLG